MQLLEPDAGGNMLSDDELAQKLHSLMMMAEGVYGAGLVTNDGFVLKNLLPPAINLDDLWMQAAPFIEGTRGQVALPDGVLLVEPGPDAALLVLVQPHANILLIQSAMQRLAHALIEPVAALLAS